ncbi:XF1762 family protein [Nonomuraea sp. SBT364]|uniref:XF1762 family protein n=1 Tax=Nonomuraea sp. SBT364 TaxID=1580530 RepID=UPI00066EC6AD|nr:XF1762 family protein [Nonomuraea sp. SBT364]
MENCNEIQKTVHDGSLNNPERRLAISPVTIQTARAFVAWTHRYLAPPAEAEFVIGVQSGRGALVGVVFVDQSHDDRTAEITCLSTDGTPNACSALHGAAWRASRSRGYQRLIACTLADEPGTSFSAAGYQRVTSYGLWQITARRGCA